MKQTTGPKVGQAAEAAEAAAPQLQSGMGGTGDQAPATRPGRLFAGRLLPLPAVFPADEHGAQDSRRRPSYSAAPGAAAAERDAGAPPRGRETPALISNARVTTVQEAGPWSAGRSFCSDQSGTLHLSDRGKQAELIKAWGEERSDPQLVRRGVRQRLMLFARFAPAHRLARFLRATAARFASARPPFPLGGG